MIGFLSIRWAQLIYHRPDQVDTGENLITSDQLRKVPFVTNPKKSLNKSIRKLSFFYDPIGRHLFRHH